MARSRRRRPSAAPPPSPAAQPSRSWWRRPSVLLALVLSGASLAVAASLHTRRPVATVTRKPGLDVLLITIDTLRADAVGAYGATHGRHAARSTAWPAEASCSARPTPTTSSPCPRTPTSCPAASPSSTACATTRGSGFPPTRATLATLLKAAGYRTGAFVSAFTLDSRFGLDRGFDVYDDQLEGPAGPLALPERRGADTVAAARALAGPGRRPSDLLLDPPVRPARPVPAAGALRVAVPGHAVRRRGRGRGRGPRARAAASPGGGLAPHRSSS